MRLEPSENNVVVAAMLSARFGIFLSLALRSAPGRKTSRPTIYGYDSRRGRSFRGASPENSSTLTNFLRPRHDGSPPNDSTGEI